MTTVADGDTLILMRDGKKLKEYNLTSFVHQTITTLQDILDDPVSDGECLACACRSAMEDCMTVYDCYSRTVSNALQHLPGCTC